MQTVEFRRRPVGRLKGRQVSPQDRERVLELLGSMPRRPDLLIECLHRIQDAERCLPAGLLAALAVELKLSQAEVFEVATFYHHFDVVREGEDRPARTTIRVCDSVSCQMAGAELLLTKLEALAARHAASAEPVRIQRVPCVGRCDEAPVAVVHQNPVGRATPESVMATLVAGQTECPLPPDALDLPAARASGTYDVLLGLLSAGRSAQALEAVFARLEGSGLRGLGGAGFPVGRKWRIVSGQTGERLLAVNGDEGEPGTFKDRHYLERAPHRFLEGMLIAAWAVGCSRCYIYLRDEYAGVRSLLERELERLGSLAAECLSASGGDWTIPPIELRRGAGAYICGEESGMLESIEGHRGMPRLRPPYIAEVGLFGQPTLAHNVETLYWIPALLAPNEPEAGQGAEWFAAQGRRERRGLRSFSVSGRVARPGVKLAPAGISLRELIEEHCGGMLPGHTLYAYLPGGASGGILPAALADEPLDFDTLQKHGCFIGSAAVVVLSNQDRVADVARNLMGFFRHESCGQCTPCRVGTAKAETLMALPVWDQPLLEELSSVMMDASICGLGQAAPNPLLCVLRYFPDEVRAAPESPSTPAELCS